MAPKADPTARPRRLSIRLTSRNAAFVARRARETGKTQADIINEMIERAEVGAIAALHNARVAA